MLYNEKRIMVEWVRWFKNHFVEWKDGKDGD